MSKGKAARFLAILVSASVFCCSAYAKSSAENILDLKKMAMDSYIRGECDEALSLYQQAATAATKAYGPNSGYVAELYYDMGVVAFQNSRFQKAQEWLESSVNINPNQVVARVKLAELLTLEGKPDDARRHVKAVLAKHNDCVQARKILAQTYQAEGMSARATMEFGKISQILNGAKKNQEPDEAVAALPLMPAAPPVVKQKPAVEKSETATAKAAKPTAAKPAPVKTPAAKPAPAKPSAAAIAKLQVKPKAKLPVVAKAKTPPKPKQQPAVTTASAEFGADQPQFGLRSKAILLTPVNKKDKKPAEAAATASKPAAKPAEKAAAKPPAAEKPAEKPAVTALTTKPAAEKPTESASEDKPKPAKPKSQPAMDPNVTASSVDTSGGGEEEDAPKPSAKKEKPKPVEVKKTVPVVVKQARPRNGLVPPPPPLIPIGAPVYGGMGMPPPNMMPMAQPVVKPKKKEKPKEVESSAPGPDDDFLLEWAGKKKSK